MTRTYKNFSIFQARIADMRNLFEPSREFRGQPSLKPNYYIQAVIAKTKPNWFEEPLLTAFTRACQSVYETDMKSIPFAMVDWPIKDGDALAPGRTTIAEWRKGQWFLTASSQNKVIVKKIVDGQAEELPAPLGVKTGDYIGIGGAVSVKANDPRGIKAFLNTVMFMGEGEEISVGSSASVMDLMADAKAQGMNVTGFTSTQTGFGSPTPPWPTAPAPVQPLQQPQPNGGGFGGYSGFTPPTGFPRN
jgi:hypothetical protein